MREHERSARNLLLLVREQADAIGCAVSFGKDSLATLSLCARTFRRVEGFYLYRVPGLEIVAKWSREVKDRFGIDIRQYAHFDLSRCYRNAILQPHWKESVHAPKIKMSDVENRFRSEADIDWIAYGWRRNDSFSRALIMKKCGGIDWTARRVFPLRSWLRNEVYQYLESQKIPKPETLGRVEQGGLDFNAGALFVLREQYPEDYQRWLLSFPFSDVMIARQETER